MSAAWMLSTLLFLAGVAVAAVGVGIFGWYFIRANARAAQQRGEAAVAWGGAQAGLGIIVLTAGICMHMAGYLLRVVLSSLA